MRFATILGALVLCLVNIGPTVSRAVVQRNADKEGDDSYPNPDWVDGMVERAAVERNADKEGDDSYPNPDWADGMVARVAVERNADKEGDDSYPNPDWADMKRAPISPAVEARLNEEEEGGVLVGAKRAFIV
ncbi:hypothetical protein C8R47DRAFT_187569 [Mycena vitilis]|nr:hypothetical protein C8R47DRAFT_187569 [Mycena vitilis]